MDGPLERRAARLRRVRATVRRTCCARAPRRSAARSSCCARRRATTTVFGQLLRERDLTVDGDRGPAPRGRALAAAPRVAARRAAAGPVRAAPCLRCAALATGWSRSASSTRPCSTRARDGIVTADADGIITYANPAANQISGSGSSSAGRSARRVSTDAIAQTLRDGETRHVEQELIAREDGVEQIVRVRGDRAEDRGSRHRPRVGLSRHLRPRPGRPSGRGRARGHARAGRGEQRSRRPCRSSRSRCAPRWAGRSAAPGSCTTATCSCGRCGHHRPRSTTR